MTIINILLYMGMGVLLAHMGHGLTSWQFWAVMLILAAVGIVSYIKAKS